MVVSRGVVAATAVLAAAACTASAAASPYAESAGVYGNSDMEIGSYGDYTPGEPSRPLAMEPDDTDAPTPAPTPADMPSAVPTMPSGETPHGASTPFRGMSWTGVCGRSRCM